jgi:Toprim domain
VARACGLILAFASEAATMLPAHFIAKELALKAETLVRELFPDAKIHGNELRWHGPGGAVCSMVLRGAKRGVWANWSDPENQTGDALELVHHALFAGEHDRRSALRWAARWLGVDRRTADRDSRVLELRRKAVEAMQRQAQEDKLRAERASKRALAMYLDHGLSIPLPRATELVSYFAGRGIPLEDLSEVPRTLRFEAGCSYDAQLDLPAMLAPIIDPISCEQIGTHATYLEQDGTGVWHKTLLRPAKKCHGTVKGGFIPLLRGGSHKGWSHMPDGETILIAEGIENALAASLCVDGGPRVIACVAVGNLPSLALPEACRRVILVYDRDGENQGVHTAREAARERFRSERRDIEILKPPAGVKDFADYVAADWDRPRGFV